jgi:hypothetical protein
MDKYKRARKAAMPREQKTKGRPPKLAEGENRVMYYDSGLHAFISERMPEFVEGGRIKVAKLAAAMKYSEYRVYVLLTENRLTIRALNALVAASDKKDRPDGQGVTKDDLVPYLLN